MSLGILTSRGITYIKYVCVVADCGYTYPCFYFGTTLNTRSFIGYFFQDAIFNLNSRCTVVWKYLYSFFISGNSQRTPETETMVNKIMQAEEVQNCGKILTPASSKQLYYSHTSVAYVHVSGTTTTTTGSQCHVLQPDSHDLMFSPGLAAANHVPPSNSHSHCILFSHIHWSFTKSKKSPLCPSPGLLLAGPIYPPCTWQTIFIFKISHGNNGRTWRQRRRWLCYGWNEQIRL